MNYVPDSILEEIERLKLDGKYDEALHLANQILIKNPKNEDALFQVADIQYLKWEIGNAEKSVDFLLNIKWDSDPIWLYVKWVLEMEKTNWKDAKKYLRKALEIVNFENPEMMRCYGLSEYWLGNREKGIDFLEKAYEINKLDAEIIYNLIEIYLLEKKHNKAKKMIEMYYKEKENLSLFGRPIEFYDEKINLFNQYLKNI